MGDPSIASISSFVMSPQASNFGAAWAGEAEGVGVALGELADFAGVFFARASGAVAFPQPARATRQNKETKIFSRMDAIRPVIILLCQPWSFCKCMNSHSKQCQYLALTRFSSRGMLLLSQTGKGSSTRGLLLVIKGVRRWRSFGIIGLKPVQRDK